MKEVKPDLCFILVVLIIHQKKLQEQLVTACKIYSKYRMH